MTLIQAVERESSSTDVHKPTLISARLIRPLTIRARLAASYSLVIAVVLAVVALAVGGVHRRLGMTRIDAELTGAMRTVAGVVASEIDERSSLELGAKEALVELELPGVGVSVVDSTDRPLSMRASGAPTLTPARMATIAIDAPPRTLEPERVRVAASSWQHGGDAYRVVCWVSLEPFDREHATVMNTVGLAIPFAAAVALIGGWVFVQRALRPLAAMAARVDAIDRGHLDTRLPTPEAADELHRLSVAFNGLLDRLSDSLGAQRRFMTDASHELRTPVSVVRTTAQVTLSLPHRVESEYREALDIVASQASRLGHVVDDMFLLALADAGGRALLLRYLYFDELVAECIRGVAVLADQRHISISFSSPEGVQMRGDEELLRRMVTNLVDNAVRYSPDEGQVHVAIAADAGKIVLAIRDSGPGIPLAEHDRVFERFIRLETARPTSGGGLGLPIARWIAEQHDGTLKLESNGQGTSFIATFRVI